MLNRLDPVMTVEINDDDDDDDDDDDNEEIEEGPVTKLEIKNAIKDMNYQAAGIDIITVEASRQDQS